MNRPPDPSVDGSDNEQLEFLGDAVVGLIAADSLYRRYPELREGELTRLRAALVSRQHLGKVGLKLDLGAYLFLGKGEERNGGRTKAALMANCIEAVIGAVYLDGGLRRPESSSSDGSSNHMWRNFARRWNVVTGLAIISRRCRSFSRPGKPGSRSL